MPLDVMSIVKNTRYLFDFSYDSSMRMRPITRSNGARSRRRSRVRRCNFSRDASPVLILPGARLCLPPLPASTAVSTSCSGWGNAAALRNSDEPGGQPTSGTPAPGAALALSLRRPAVERQAARNRGHAEERLLLLYPVFRNESKNTR